MNNLDHIWVEHYLETFYYFDDSEDKQYACNICGLRKNISYDGKISYVNEYDTFDCNEIKIKNLKKSLLR